VCSCGVVFYLFRLEVFGVVTDGNCPIDVRGLA